MAAPSRQAVLRVGVVVVAAAAITGTLVPVASAAVAAQSGSAAAVAPAGPVQSAMLKSGDTLAPGQDVSSANGQYTLRMQLDGNLVLFRSTGAVVWHAGTAPNPGASARMQLDGNLVVFTPAGKVLWHAGTAPNPGATAHVQNDGNMTIRKPSGEVLWAVSDQIAKQAQLRSGEVLRAGQERRSLDGKITLRMQADGNLVLIDSAKKVLWHAGTAPSPGASAHMQRDGNMTVVSATNKPLWHSGTQGSDITAHVQNDGNLTLRTPDGKVIWARR